MTQWLHDLYWGDVSPVDMVGKYDKQYRQTREKCCKVSDALEAKLPSELTGDFEALGSLWEACSSMEQEYAFALGCGFAFRLMMDTVPLLNRA